MGRWFAETLHEDVRFSFRSGNVLYEQRTAHQDLVLFENAAFGKVLMLDGVTQVTTADEFIYHEMMSHVPLFAHGAARRVLIVGGGDCGIAEEVLKHAALERLVLAEIDQSVVDFSKEHFAEFNAAAFEDPRLDIRIGDGMAFVAETEERFDVIIVDSTDPIGPGKILFSQAFYDACHRALADGGVMVTQNGVPFMQGEELTTSIRRFSAKFADVHAYIAAIPTYVGGHMALGWAAKNPGLRQTELSVLTERFAATGITTRYYTPAVHVAAFALPRYIDDLVEQGR